MNYTLLLKLFTVQMLFAFLTANGQYDPSFKTGLELYDEALQFFYEEEHFEAIGLFNQIHPNDSIYPEVARIMAVCYTRLEKYNKAISFAKTSLELDPHDSRKYDLLGQLYELQGEFELMKMTYDQALKKFPLNQEFICKKGNALYELGDEEGAYELYKSANEMSLIRGLPNFYLADLCHKEDLPTQGFLSIMTHLALNPENTNSFAALTFLEELSNNALGDPGRLGDPVVEREFNDIDVLIQNKVALSSKFQTPSKFDFSFVKQAYLILSQIVDNPPETEGYWAKTYVPIYTEIMKREDFDVLMLLIMASSDNPTIQKEIKKNKQKIIDFKNWFSSKLSDQKVELETDIPGEFNAYNKLYHDNGQVKGLGKINNDQLIGTWHLYDEFGALSIIGNFKEGSAHGEWKYFNREGGLSKMLTFYNNQVHGPYRVNHDNGALYEKGFYNKEEVDGTVEVYGRSGILENTENFSNGLREGAAKYYFANGNLEFDFAYKENRIDGTLTEYYPTGQEYSISSIKNGKRVGKATTKYLNGVVSEEKNFEQGELEGPFLTYFPDGSPSSIGKATKNNMAGEWKEFYENGVVSSKSYFGENGKLSGKKERFTEEGMLFELSTFSKGDLKSIRYLDEEGEEVFNAEEKNGKIFTKYFDPLLNLESEGRIEDGQRQGDWKFYKNDVVVEIEPFIDNQLDGVNYIYFPDGNTKSIFYYNKDKLNGKFEIYDRFGQKTNQGFYRNGLREGLYQSYFSDGTLKSEIYYYKGRQIAETKFYAPNGKLHFTYTYDNKGDLVNYTNFDSLENPVNSIDLVYGKGEYELKFETGEKYTYGTYINSKLNGPREWFYPNGKIRSKGLYFDDQRMGEWEWYYPSGIISTKTSYYNGERHGLHHEYFPNGKLELEVNYFRGNEEGLYMRYYQDGQKKSELEYVGGQLHGKAIYYNLSGNVLMIRYYDRGRMTAYSYLGPDNNEVDPIPLQNETGKITAYYPNGKKSFEFSIDKGWFTGEYYQYHEDGTVLQESFFEKDLHAKPRKAYWKNGNLRSVYNYKLGELDGKYTRYNLDGSKVLEMNYKSGELHGWTHVFDEINEEQHSFLFYNGTIIAMK